MFTCELERMVHEHEQQIELNNLILTKANTLITKWKVDNNRFIIVSNSTKKKDHIQFTMFYKNQPWSDSQHTDYKEIAEKLAEYSATIEIINYIN